MAAKKLTPKKISQLRQDLTPHVFLPSLKMIGQHYGVNQATVSYHMRQMRQGLLKFQK